MAFRTLAAVIIVVFAAVLVWGVTAGPLNQIGNDFQELDDSSQDLDGVDNSQTITDLIDQYFSMFWILILGIMTWGTWVVFRKEITQKGGVN